MAETKNLLLRLDPDLAAQLQAVAAVESRTVTDLVREAIADLVQARRDDADFQRRLRRSAREHEQILRRLRREP